MSARALRPAGSGPPPGTGATGASRRRDAEATRTLLVDAARRRFARDGYQATTVRDVAADAGVNAALVNRYFTSKEGLFEACMPRRLDHLGEPGADLEEAVQRLVLRVCSSGPDDDLRLPLLLLLRSSGDDRADQIRRDTLRGFAEHLAGAAGRRAGDPGTEHVVLRAEIAVGALLGMVVLRSSIAVEPLASTEATQLVVPLRAAIHALLDPTTSPPSAVTGPRATGPGADAPAAGTSADPGGAARTETAGRGAGAGEQ